MKVIDTQAHWYPRAMWEAYLDRAEYPRCRRQDDGYAFELAPDRWLPIQPHYLELELQFEEMDAAGVDVMISSSASFGEADWQPLPQARELASTLNQIRANAQREYGGRFYGVATIPWQHAEAAIEVLDDAILQLGLKGVLLHSNVDGAPVDEDRFRPIYRRIAELGVPVFIHPGRTIMEEKVRPYGLEYLVAYMFDTSLAALRLVLSGILEELPDLVVVHPHLGATLPYLAGRIDAGYEKPYAVGRTMAMPPSAYLRRNFYTDTVAQSPPALRFAKEFYGLDHLLFGSDYPFFFPKEGVDFVRENLNEEESEQVLGGNAARLLRLEPA